jgi:lipoic acid synthetase
MILGGVCTRSCGFCDVPTGRPEGLDLDEPLRVAEALSKLSLPTHRHHFCEPRRASDGGARVWADTIRAVRAAVPEMTIEVLIPDFKGSESALATVLAARPGYLAH